MTSGSVAEAINNYLSHDCGEYGRPSGIRPWVVADVTRFFEEHAATEGLVFLLCAKGYSQHQAARELGVSHTSVWRIIHGPLQGVVSLLDMAELC